LTELKEEGGEGNGGSVKVLTFENYFFWRAPLIVIYSYINIYLNQKWGSVDELGTLLGGGADGGHEYRVRGT